MSTKLYVGNLPFEATEADLQALFESAGQVSTINIIRDRATGQARGFAFVEMSDTEGAQRAIRELDKHQYGGRSLTVNEAKPMAPRGNGGGGGGFGVSVANRAGNGASFSSKCETAPALRMKIRDGSLSKKPLGSLRLHRHHRVDRSRACAACWGCRASTHIGP
jgi:RNA recognition motif-containing protein